MSCRMEWVKNRNENLMLIEMLQCCGLAALFEIFKQWKMLLSAFYIKRKLPGDRFISELGACGIF